MEEFQGSTDPWELLTLEIVMRHTHFTRMLQQRGLCIKLDGPRKHTVLYNRIEEKNKHYKVITEMQQCFWDRNTDFV